MTLRRRPAGAAAAPRSPGASEMTLRRLGPAPTPLLRTPRASSGPNAAARIARRIQDILNSSWSKVKGISCYRRHGGSSLKINKGFRQFTYKERYTNCEYKTTSSGYRLGIDHMGNFCSKCFRTGKVLKLRSGPNKGTQLYSICGNTCRFNRCNFVIIDYNEEKYSLSNILRLILNKLRLKNPILFSTFQQPLVLEYNKKLPIRDRFRRCHTLNYPVSVIDIHLQTIFTLYTKYKARGNTHANCTVYIGWSTVSKKRANFHIANAERICANFSAEPEIFPLSPILLDDAREIERNLISAMQNKIQEAGYDWIRCTNARPGGEGHVKGKRGQVYLYCQFHGIINK